MIATQKAALPSVMDGNGELPTVIEEAGDCSVAIGFDGYGTKDMASGYGRPVIIENRNGVPYVIVWADINEEDPTHVISLWGAKE